MDEERLEGSVRAVRRICEGVVNQGGSWSADAVTLAKALMAITRDNERVAMYPERAVSLGLLGHGAATPKQACQQD